MTVGSSAAGKATKASKAWAVAALLATMFFWGTSAVFMRTTGLSLAPENALALRYVFLVPLFGGALAASGLWRIARADWPRLMIAALLGLFGSSWFSMQGFSRVAAGLGSVILMFEPIIIALLALALIREPISRRLWLGLAVSVTGGIVLFWPDLGAAALQPVDPWGVAALLGASTCFAIYTIGVKPLMARYSGFAVTAWSTLIAAPLVFFMASKPYGELLRTTEPGTWLELLYLAVFNSILGNVLWTYGSGRLSGAAAGSFLYLLPVVAIIAGYFWLGEPVTLYLAAGSLIVLAGVALAQQGSGPR